MLIGIHAVGRMKSGPERDLVKRYLDRFTAAGKPLGLNFSGVTEAAESRAQTAAGRAAEESARLKGWLGEGRTLIVLDDAGKSMTSEAFARRLASLRDDGVNDCIFAIGGADGHDPQIMKSARLVLSFGRFTWPHQLARIMLAEQLYRAATILSGHPYHRA